MAEESIVRSQSKKCPMWKKKDLDDDSSSHDDGESIECLEEVMKNEIGELSDATSESYDYEVIEKNWKKKDKRTKKKQMIAVSIPVIME